MRAAGASLDEDLCQSATARFQDGQHVARRGGVSRNVGPCLKLAVRGPRDDQLCLAVRHRVGRRHRVQVLAQRFHLGRPDRRGLVARPGPLLEPRRLIARRDTLHEPLHLGRKPRRLCGGLRRLCALRLGPKGFRRRRPSSSSHCFAPSLVVRATPRLPGRGERGLPDALQSSDEAMRRSAGPGRRRSATARPAVAHQRASRRTRCILRCSKLLFLPATSYIYQRPFQLFPRKVPVSALPQKRQIPPERFERTDDSRGKSGGVPEC